MNRASWPSRARSHRRDRGTSIGGLMAQIVKAEARKETAPPERPYVLGYFGRNVFAEGFASGEERCA